MVEASPPAATPASRPNLSVWIKTARVNSLTATISPLLVGTAVAARDGAFYPLRFLAALAGGLFLQVGANFYNEYFDWRYDLDNEHSLGASTVIFRGEMTAGQVFWGGVGSFALAVLCGIFLILSVGPGIILFGLAGMAIAYFYSARPFTFAKRGLGDPLVFIAMGLLMTWGAYFVQLPRWSWGAFAASVPVGFLVDAILNMNNLRDEPDDRAVGKMTLPVRFGHRFGLGFHLFLVLGSYVAVTIAVATRALPVVSLAAWLTLPLAISHLRTIASTTDRKVLAHGMKDISRLNLSFGVLLALAIAVAAIAHMRF